MVLTLLIAVVLTGWQQATASNFSLHQSSARSETKQAKSDQAKAAAPRFRATKAEIKKAQEILKQKGLYSGEISDKLNADVRAAIRKFQQDNGLKATGTLNRETLEKLGVPISERKSKSAKPPAKS